MDSSANFAEKEKGPTKQVIQMSVTGEL